MPQKFIAPDAFRAIARAGGTPTEGVLHALAASPESVDEQSRRLRYCCSDNSIDLAGDNIEQDGWDLSQIKRNNPALWAHMSYEPPIGKVVDVGVERGRLMGTIQFATAEEYSFADTIFRLAKGGYINAVSVGFIPTEWTFVEDKDRPYGITFKKQTLLEVSLCPIPCNSNALQEGKAAGIDIAPLREWIERQLDGEGQAVLPRKQLESILALPEKFRGIAKTLPAAAKGARGQLLRCANIAEREIKVEAEEVVADDDVAAENAAAQEQESPATPAGPETAGDAPATAPPESAAAPEAAEASAETPNLDMAMRKLAIIKHQLP
jgi:HK97 family phage prohead protease